MIKLIAFIIFFFPLFLGVISGLFSSVHGRTIYRPIYNLSERVVENSFDRRIEESSDSSLQVSIPSDDMVSSLNELLLAVQNHGSENPLMNHEKINNRGDEEGEEIENIILNDDVPPYLDEAPLTIPLDEYQAIKRKFGTVIADSITTTIEQGGTGAIDVMIGAFRNGFLHYKNSSVKLIGPDIDTKGVIIVKGFFSGPEHFQVLEWVNADQVSANQPVFQEII